MNINLNLYKYFYSVAKFNSFTKAAEELMISQPSLSYSVKTLEEHLDKRLFDRTTKGIVLTKEGNELFEMLKPIMEKFDSITDNESLKGKITIGVRQMYALHCLPARIKLINILFPEIEIDYKIGLSEDLSDLLRNEKIDLMIDEVPYEGAKYITIKGFAPENCFIASKTSSRDKVTLEDLQKDGFLVVKSNKNSYELTKRFPDAKHEDILNTPMLIDEIESTDKIGLSLLPICGDYIKMGRVKMLDTNLDLKVDGYFYVSFFKQDKKIEKIASIFKDYDYLEAIERVKNK